MGMATTVLRQFGIFPVCAHFSMQFTCSSELFFLHLAFTLHTSVGKLNTNAVMVSEMAACFYFQLHVDSFLSLCYDDEVISDTASGCT
jgi:hypothetical protein